MARSAEPPASDEIEYRMIHRRAVEAVIGGMSAVNFDLMLPALINGGGAPNQIVYWSGRRAGSRSRPVRTPFT